MSIRPVTVLEVGTARTVALVGDAAPDGSPRVLGFGQCETAGMRKSRVTDREQVADCAAAAISAAREDARCTIGSVVLLCSLGDVRDAAVSAAADVEGGEDGVVDAAAVAAARAGLPAASTVPEGRFAIGNFPTGFTLDGGSARLLDPLEMHARRIEAHALLLHTDDHLMGDLVDAVELKSGVEVEEEFFTGLAAAGAALSDEQKRDGALLLDFGAGSTSWCGYADGVPVCGGSLAVGGDHVTNDVYVAFRTGSRLMAERLKLESATVDLGSVERGERVPVPVAFGAPDRTIPRFSLAQVAEARMRETLGIVRERLRAQGALDRFGAVVLSGGGARLRGLPAMVSEVFSAPTFAPAAASGDRRLDADPLRNAAAWGGLRAAVARARNADTARRRGIWGRLLGGDGAAG
ncbi:MAG: cell division protein FtsA [Kiritimatiellae bacterium]|nr:cell division protein FtsA [Kiritimatiellia bacterium]